MENDQNELIANSMIWLLQYLYTKEVIFKFQHKLILFFWVIFLFKIKFSVLYRPIKWWMVICAFTIVLMTLHLTFHTRIPSFKKLLTNQTRKNSSPNDSSSSAQISKFSSQTYVHTAWFARNQVKLSILNRVLVAAQQ